MNLRPAPERWSETDIGQNALHDGAPAGIVTPRPPTHERSTAALRKIGSVAAVQPTNRILDTWFGSAKVLSGILLRVSGTLGEEAHAPYGQAFSRGGRVGRDRDRIRPDLCGHRPAHSHGRGHHRRSFDRGAHQAAECVRLSVGTPAAGRSVRTAGPDD